MNDLKSDIEKEWNNILPEVTPKLIKSVPQ